MSLKWCQEHCPKTHHPKGVQAINTVGRPYWCPLFPDFMGKCFIHCNLDSDQICGDCVHWYGHVTFDDKRHARFGKCPFQIGSVTANWHNDCPHFYKRPEYFPDAFPDWVEAQVEKTGINPASPDARPHRIEARKRWFEMWK